MNTTEAREGWTDQRVEQLKKLVAEGNLSSSQIASMLGGGLTRNAVIGKVTRLKLPGRRTRAQIRSDAIARSRIQHAPPKPHRNKGQTKANVIVKRAAARAVLPEFEEAPLPIEDGIDCTDLIGMLELSDHTCKWPHGDPLKEGFGFCGKPSAAGKPYCPDHCKRAFHTVEQNRSKAAEYLAVKKAVSAGDKQYGGAVS